MKHLIITSARAKMFQMFQQTFALQRLFEKWYIRKHEYHRENSDVELKRLFKENL